MTKRILTLAVLILFAASYITAQTEKPLPADQIMKEAYAKAAESGKNVFVIFHASWCTWCKRLDKAMQSDELKKIFEDNYVIVHIDVLERGEAIEKFENPGGKELMKKLGGEGQGIPFFAFVGPKANIRANSLVMPDYSNIGYPGSADEMEEFMRIAKLGAPKMSEEQCSTILKYLKDNAPKPRQ